MIPESETGILPCEILWLAQLELRLSQRRIVLSSDVSKKTTDKFLKGTTYKVTGKRKEPSD